jgi:c-di-GMP-binding flagellar brake protein YcgR
MLKTTLFPEPMSAALAPYVVSSRDDIVELMNRLRNSDVTVTCYIEGGFIPAEARIEEVLTAADILVLVAASEVEHDTLSTARAITVVAFLGGVKIQFSAVADGGIATASGVGVRVSIPAQVVRLQRRGHERVKPSRIRPLECTVRGELNMPSLLRMPVLDIGVNGVALLARVRQDSLLPGQRLFNCVFDLAEDGEITTDLVVRNVERLESSGGWRYGCTFIGITDRALEQVCSYVERLKVQQRSAFSND